MATYPTGVISFLYNVINDADINQKFQSDDQYEVMEFFMLSDELRAAFKKGGDRLKAYQDRTLKETGQDHLSQREVLSFAEGLFKEPDTAPQLDVISAAVIEELKNCFGRMW